jgi:dihydropteroate synthase
MPKNQTLKHSGTQELRHSNAQTLNCSGHLLDLSVPIVMGILNVTNDSFFDGGRYTGEKQMLEQVEKMLLEGAAMLDIGGASSRPGAASIPEDLELQRTTTAIEKILHSFPGAVLSIDTWRARVAEEAVAAGAAMVNDISGGNMDASMHETLGRLGVPYVLMHMQGQPNNMQRNPQYEDVVTEVLDFFIHKIQMLHQVGVYDIIIDPGFGFGKTVEHNYALLRHMNTFKTVLQLPLLAGISRKSMICKPLGIKPEAALNGTTALHMIALQQGADILRAHDVREAKEVIQLWLTAYG